MEMATAKKIKKIANIVKNPKKIQLMDCSFDDLGSII